MKVIMILAMLILLTAPVLAICGDGVCDGEEYCMNCDEDCPLNIVGLGNCLINDSNCNTDAEHEFVIDVAIFIFVIGTFIYLQKKGFI